MPSRSYRMRKRAAAQDDTRDKIVRATIALHDARGVAATSYLDVAAKAGVGVATVYRHFPTPGSLVAACGAHVWAEMRPPDPQAVERAFAGVRGRRARIEILVAELDGFYGRGAHRLTGAARDRDTIPELDAFLKEIELRVALLVRAALGDAASEAAVRAVVALSDFSVWRLLTRLDFDGAGSSAFKADMLLAAADSGERLAAG